MGKTNKQERPDFNQLYRLLLSEMTRIDNRYKSVLLNNENSKEKICRKLGVVSVSDVVRFTKTVSESNYLSVK